MKVADHIAAYAVTCQGTPFAHQGRLPGRGIDCAGLVVGALLSAGALVEDRLDYGERPNPRHVRESLQANGFREIGTDLRQRRSGDVLLCWIGRPANAVHMLPCVGQGAANIERGGTVSVFQMVPEGCAAQLSGIWRHGG